MKLEITRRKFLNLGACALASSSFMGTLGMLNRVMAQTATLNTTGYKALVCLYLTGGNQAFNTVVPTTTAGYNTYAKSRGGLALAQKTLLPINGTATDGYSYGFHPSCPEMQGLFNAGNLAILCNVGTLVQPTATIDAKNIVQGLPPVQDLTAVVPPQLFSHIDQWNLWQTSIANDINSRFGWAGRVADLYNAQGYRPHLSMNIDIGGTNYLQSGAVTGPYVLPEGGNPDVMALTNDGSRGGTASAILNQAATDPSLMTQVYAGIQQKAAVDVVTITNAWNASSAVTTTFPNNPSDGGLGGALGQVVRVINAHAALGDARQIFFVNLGGFDTHNTELATQQTLLGILSSYMKTFWTAINAIGMQNNVTMFSASEFGRSLAPNSDGSDHGWGSHHFIMGGAVNGGKYYGAMPDLTLNGNNDVDGSGRMVPTTSTDQYAATLAKWFGVPDATNPATGNSYLDDLFPNLKNFSLAANSRDLGFLKPG